jgi:hypothetical protein
MLKRFALILISTVVIAIPLASYAATGDSSLFPPTRATGELISGSSTVQDLKLEETLDSIASLVESLPDTSGLAEMEINLPSPTLTVRWKGDLPSDFAGVESAAVDAGVDLRIVPAKYSQQEILSAGRLLRSTLYGLESRPTLIHGTRTRDGLFVGVSDEAAKLQSLSELAKLYEDLTSMPVEVEVVGAMVGASRQNDASPWSGGSGMKNSATSSYCSTGFAVLSGSAGRLLSAAHCDLSGNAKWSNGVGSVQLTNGDASVQVRQHDWESLLIDPTNGTQGKVHGGPWYANSADPHYKMSVAASSATVVGNSVCTSGANSGEHCGLTVTDSQALFGCPVTGFDCYGSVATSSNQDIAIAQGDSGGPVYGYNADGRVRAKGIISGFASGWTVSCPSLAVPGVLCADQFFYVGINPLLTFWGVSLETSP